MQPIDSHPEKKPAPKTRESVSFDVDGENISAWYYPPPKKSASCVILCHGFGGTKDMLLENYALQFQKAGIAALAFDYRHFGDSDGEPRQSYIFKKQFDDLRAAVAYSRSKNEIDEDKIFIWGTSASGNYGITIAAEDEKIAGVIGQCPSLDHKADEKIYMKRDGMRWFLKILIHAQRDKGRSRFGLAPHRFPIVGRAGSIAMLPAPGAIEGYEKISRGSQTFKNEVCARLMLQSPGPNLFKSAEKIKCPVIFFICMRDNLVAPDASETIKNILKEKLKLVFYDIGHFEIYEGEYFKKAVAEQIEFIRSI